MQEKDLTSLHSDKIRPFYINNPDAFFFILSIEHQSIINNNKCYGFHLVDCNIFDLKYVSKNELKFNTAMGDQFQISNSMKVTQTERTTDEFIALIDNMSSINILKTNLINLLPPKKPIIAQHLFLRT